MKSGPDAAPGHQYLGYIRTRLGQKEGARLKDEFAARAGLQHAGGEQVLAAPAFKEDLALAIRLRKG